MPCCWQRLSLGGLRRHNDKTSIEQRAAKENIGCFATQFPPTVNLWRNLFKQCAGIPNTGNAIIENSAGICSSVLVRKRCAHAYPKDRGSGSARCRLLRWPLLGASRIARNRTRGHLGAVSNSNNFIVFDKYGLIVPLTRHWVDRGDVANHQVVTGRICNTSFQPSMPQ